jgi:hypothetical protein
VANLSGFSSWPVPMASTVGCTIEAMGVGNGQLREEYRCLRRALVVEDLVKRVLHGYQISLIDHHLVDVLVRLGSLV